MKRYTFSRHRICDTTKRLFTTDASARRYAMGKGYTHAHRDNGIQVFPIAHLAPPPVNRSREFLAELRFLTEVANLQTVIGDTQGTGKTFMTMLRLASDYDRVTLTAVATNVALTSPKGLTLVAAKLVRSIQNLYLR